MRCLAVGLLAVAALMATSASALAVPANERWVFTEGEYRCEGNEEESLAKVVCRNVGNWDDFYVIYFDIDESRDTVFLDGFRPAGGGLSTITQEQMSIATFRSRYGR